ncbi:MAG TPA: hypothetical protein VFQ14_04345 [Thermoleophilaceae bacterium]|nr:hypothetical protein [Thermoleophilaceae bacterium]
MDASVNGEQIDGRLVAADDVRRCASRGVARIELRERTIVTPEARDVAKELGIALVPAEHVPPPPPVTPQATPVVDDGVRETVDDITDRVLAQVGRPVPRQEVQSLVQRALRDAAHAADNGAGTCGCPHL